VEVVRHESSKATPTLFSERYGCAACGISMPEMEPRHFSFNSPFGACAECEGIGTLLRVDPARVVPDESLSIAGGAVSAWGDPESTWTGGALKSLARAYDFSLATPWRKLASRVRELVLQGSGGAEVRFEFKTRNLRRGSYADAQAAYGPHFDERRSVTRRTRQVI